MGPAKPQRSATSITSTVINLQETLKMSPNLTPPPNKLCLETSFASLQTKSESHKLNNGHSWEFCANDSLLTSFEGTRSKSRVDLIHDDWLGLAPLATAESLSEVSSIASRRESFVMARLDKQRKDSDSHSGDRNSKIKEETDKSLVNNNESKNVIKSSANKQAADPGDQKEQSSSSQDEDLIANFSYESSPLLNILHNPKIAEFMGCKEDPVSTSSSDCFYEFSPNSSRFNSPFTNQMGKTSVHSSSGTNNDIYFSLESDGTTELVVNSSTESLTLHQQMEDSSVTSATFTDGQYEECPDDLKPMTPLDDEYGSLNFNSSYKTCPEPPSDYSALKASICDNSATCDFTSDSEWSSSRAPSSAADNAIGILPKSAPSSSDKWNNNDNSNLVNLIGDNKTSGHNGQPETHSDFTCPLIFPEGESSV